jgi:hypothetical protein
VLCMDEHSDSITKIETDKLCLALLETSGANRITLMLRFRSQESLTRFSALLNSISNSNGNLVDLSNAFQYQGDCVPQRTVLSRSKPGKAESLYFSLKHENPPGASSEHVQVFIWEGDGEYWRECAEKCANLAEAKRGFQYLMVRGSESQQVEITLKVS